MSELNTFLYAIGIYNIIGGFFMFTLLYEPIAESFCRICELFTATYHSTKESTLWLLWAAWLNTLYGMMNIVALRWDSMAKQDLLVGNIILYTFFIGLTFMAWRLLNMTVGFYSISLYLASG